MANDERGYPPALRRLSATDGITAPGTVTIGWRNVGCFVVSLFEGGYGDCSLQGFPWGKGGLMSHKRVSAAQNRLHSLA